MDEWLLRERNTAHAIKLCFPLAEAMKFSADALYALCQLTWITKNNLSDAADNTARVVAPALTTLLGQPITAPSIGQLGPALRRVNARPAVTKAFGTELGFVNFYTAYRNVALPWLSENRAAVRGIFEEAIAAESDADILAIYDKLGALPPIPNEKAETKAHFLLSPVVACLDPRSRAPIINGRGFVHERLKLLGLANAPLREQCKGLLALMDHMELADAFALDRSAIEDVQDVAELVLASAGGQQLPRHRALRDRVDDDVEVLKKSLSLKYTRLHNTMTNALSAICERMQLTVNEGQSPACRYDALVFRYAKQRDLLIEVKTSSEMPVCRLAVGQLLDYRRYLPNREATDLAVLLPHQPDQQAMDYVHDVGIYVLWFDSKMQSIAGDVRFSRPKRRTRRS